MIRFAAEPYAVSVFAYYLDLHSSQIRRKSESTPNLRPIDLWFGAKCGVPAGTCGKN